MSERDLKCLRCGKGMKYITTEELQLGKTSWIFGDLPNLVAGAMEVSIYSCPGCGKLELFQAEEFSELPQKTCPQCGKEHDFDYPKCPFCKHEY